MALHPVTYCSQCGNAFGPGDHGFSHCKNHKGKRSLTSRAEERGAIEAVARLKALLERTTPGPWAANRHGVIVGGKLYDFTMSRAPAQVAMTTVMEPDNGNQDANAHFIAAARNDIEMICDALLSTSSAERGMREALEALARPDGFARLTHSEEKAARIDFARAALATKGEG